MSGVGAGKEIDAGVARWRAFVERRSTLTRADVDELEDHLREQVADLVTILNPDEAFLVAVRRLGRQDELSREYARVHSGRLWKHLTRVESEPERKASRRELVLVLGLAVLAAASIRIPTLFGVTFEDDATFYAVNGSFFFLPMIAAYFLWSRRAQVGVVLTVVGSFVVAAVLANSYPFMAEGHTALLAAVHWPIALWLVAGVAYVGGDWRSREHRMDYIRFTGEWIVYMSLIALGGGVLSATTEGVFALVDVDVDTFVLDWLIPCGAMGAAMVAAWLVEAKKQVIENLAPVLTAIFAPLFAALLTAMAVTIPIVWRGEPIDRDALALLDVVLVIVLGLILYSMSARPPDEGPRILDGVRFALLVSALAVDGFALASILSRIADHGLTANRTAALGLNLVLLANLAWAAWLELRFLRKRREFPSLVRWQTSYIPVYLGWALVVAAIFPVVFGFD